MPDNVSIKANAKINLYLTVTGKRDDGYHLIETVMQSISLYDIVTIKKSSLNTIRIFCDKEDIPCDERNIAYKSAKTFFEISKIETFGVDIVINKNIPSQAGLGGGSTDGAAVLIGLNYLYNSNINLEQLCSIGGKIGADIPFCLIGGTALCTGIGDIIKPLSDFPECYIIIAKGDKGISTTSAYSEIDEKNLMNKTDTSVYSIFNNGSLSERCSGCGNVFEEVAHLEEVKKIKQLMNSFHALTTHMSGSGSAVYGIFSEKKNAQQCRLKLQENGFYTSLCNPEKKGLNII